jgi:hypothetical protein
VLVLRGVFGRYITIYIIIIRRRRIILIIIYIYIHTKFYCIGIFRYSIVRDSIIELTW